MDVRVDFDYNAEERDELTIKKGDIISNVSQFEEGWCIGTLNGKEGVFPDNFVKVIKESSTALKKEPEVPTRDDAPVEEQQYVDGDLEWVKVVYQYTPEQSDELELKVNDIIQILDKNLPEEGWWRGQNLKSKQVGVFPDNFVKNLDPSDSELRRLIAQFGTENKTVRPNHGTTNTAPVSSTRLSSSAGVVWSNKSKNDMAPNKSTPFLDSTMRGVGVSDRGSMKKKSTDLGDMNPTSHGLVSVVPDRNRQDSKRIVGKPLNTLGTANALRSDLKSSSGPEPNGRPSFPQQSISRSASPKKGAFVNPSSGRKVSGRPEKSAAEQFSSVSRNPSTAVNGRIRGSSANRVDSLRNAEVSSHKFLEMQQSLLNLQEQLRGYNSKLHQVASMMNELKQEQMEKITEVSSEIRDLRKQMEVMQSNLRSDIARNQNTLIDRIHTLMQEIDDLQKSRSLDSVELNRVAMIANTWDSKALAYNFGPASASGEAAINGKMQSSRSMYEVNSNASGECSQGGPRLVNSSPRK